MFGLAHSLELSANLKEELGIFVQVLRINVESIIVVPIEGMDTEIWSNTKLSQSSAGDVPILKQSSSIESLANRIENVSSDPQNARVLHQLKNSLAQHSSDASLLVINLPQPDDDEWDSLSEHTAECKHVLLVLFIFTYVG